MEYTPPPGYSLLDTDESRLLPDNWKLLESRKGRRVYHSPPPRVLVQSKKQLFDSQTAGKYLELNLVKCVFLVKQKSSTKKSFQILQNKSQNPAVTMCSDQAVESGHYAHGGSETSDTASSIASSGRDNQDRLNSSFQALGRGRSQQERRGSCQVVGRGDRCEENGRQICQGGVRGSNTENGREGYQESGRGSITKNSSKSYLGGGSGSIQERVRVSYQEGRRGSYQGSSRGEYQVLRGSQHEDGRGSCHEGGRVSCTDGEGGNHQEDGVYQQGRRGVCQEGGGGSFSPEMENNDDTCGFDMDVGVARVSSYQEDTVPNNPRQQLSKSQQKTIAHDLKKITNAVKQLTVDSESKVDHKGLLIDTAKLLSDSRSPEKQQEFSFEELKADLLSCVSLESVCDDVRCK